MRSPAGRAIGIVAVLLGLCLLLDLNGSARGAANAIKESKPMGVDYSKSFFATSAYARIFGALAVVVGTGFTVASLTGPV